MGFFVCLFLNLGDGHMDIHYFILYFWNTELSKSSFQFPVWCYGTQHLYISLKVTLPDMQWTCPGKCLVIVPNQSRYHQAVTWIPAPPLLIILAHSTRTTFGSTSHWEPLYFDHLSRSLKLTSQSKGPKIQTVNHLTKTNLLFAFPLLYS